MRPFQRWATLLVGVAGLAGLGGTMVMNATPVSAYMTMCCQFERSEAPQLVAAIWPQHWFDTSSWFENAVIDGINAWNSSPTAVDVSVEFTQDSNAQVMYWTDTNSNDVSQGGCAATRSDNTCVFGVMQLEEGCNSQGCWMQSGTPNYDMQTVAHEEGHVLGLDHSCTAGALMAGPNGNCSNGGAPYSCTSESNCVNTPQQDDINGMVALYGSGSGDSGSSCSSTSGPPAVSVPQLTLPEPPPPPTIPESSYILSIRSTVSDVESNPVGAVDNGISDAKATTGKVVPWRDVPSQVDLPGGLAVESRPC